jgi:hypothetical protein
LLGSKSILIGTLRAFKNTLTNLRYAATIVRIWVFLFNRVSLDVLEGSIVRNLYIE